MILITITTNKPNPSAIKQSFGSVDTPFVIEIADGKVTETRLIKDKDVKAYLDWDKRTITIKGDKSRTSYICDCLTLNIQDLDCLR